MAAEADGVAMDVAGVERRAEVFAARELGNGSTGPLETERSLAIQVLDREGRCVADLDTVRVRVQPSAPLAGPADELLLYRPCWRLGASTGTTSILGTTA